MLGTRPAARAIEPAMRAALENGAITLDTTGVRRIGVSFFDETLLILRELMTEVDDGVTLVYHEGPSLESLKNLAPNRGMKILKPRRETGLFHQRTEIQVGREEAYTPDYTAPIKVLFGILNRWQDLHLRLSAPVRNARTFLEAPPVERFLGFVSLTFTVLPCG